MQHQRKIFYLFAFFSLVMAAMLTVQAEDPSQPKLAVPAGTAENISDWALAGVIWSDASLTKKLATEAAKRSDDPKQQQQLLAIAEESDKLVDTLETFGWRQVKRSSKSTAARDTDDRLPDPEAVGAALAEAIDRPGNRNTSSQRNAKDSMPKTAGKPALDPKIKGFDTQTPAGRDDPGIDDERTGNNLRLDVDQYRVDDFIDETPTEARNRADAVEDGVEGAIAAAAGRLGMGRPTAGHISEREVQTRSATLPFAENSIYDSDDYDPDVDYNADNPLGALPTNPASADLGDGDDDIDRDDPAKVVDGEDELLAAMAGENRANVVGSRKNVDMDRYTKSRPNNQRDANWVQFQLNANQAIWSELTTEENIVGRTLMAITKLKSDAAAALNATENPRLTSILQSILK